jgi:hypothetical protein
MTNRRSESAPQIAASVATAGKPSRITTVAARPQQEEETVEATHALVPHASPQGCRHARSGSQPTRDRGVAGGPAGGDSAPGRGQSRGRSGSAPECAPEVLVLQEDSCVMSQRPTHDAKALMSHATPPTPDVAVAHPE